MSPNFAEKLPLKEFLAQSAGKPLRVKLIRTLSQLRGGEIPICAVCFSDEAHSFTIFNHLPVAERWDAVRQQAIQDDIYETVILEAEGKTYDEIETGNVFQFSVNWCGGEARFGPVKATELSNGNGAEFFIVKNAKAHVQKHLAESYEFLIEMLIDTPEKHWRLSGIPNYPLFLCLEELDC